MMFQKTSRVRPVNYTFCLSFVAIIDIYKSTDFSNNNFFVNYIETKVFVYLNLYISKDHTDILNFYRYKKNIFHGLV